MSMNAEENGAYIRCCNFLIEMLLKYGTDGEGEDKPRSQTKEGGDFRPHLFLFVYLFLFTFCDINVII